MATPMAEGIRAVMPPEGPSWPCRALARLIFGGAATAVTAAIPALSRLPRRFRRRGAVDDDDMLVFEVGDELLPLGVVDDTATGGVEAILSEVSWHIHVN